MKLYNILYLAVAVSLAACSGESKKVMVMASGKIAQNGDNHHTYARHYSQRSNL